VGTVDVAVDPFGYFLPGHHVNAYKFIQNFTQFPKISANISQSLILPFKTLSIIPPHLHYQQALTRMTQKQRQKTLIFPLIHSLHYAPPSDDIIKYRVNLIKFYSSLCSSSYTAVCVLVYKFF
jgi:hypothetical protein